MMKNCVEALFGSLERAIHTMPRLCGVAMKLAAVVEAFRREVDEVLHMIRRHVGKEADVDLAGARVTLGDFVLVIAHRFLLARRRVRRSAVRGDGLSRRRAAFGLRGVV